MRCYVLVNCEDTPEDSLYRCNTLKDLGVLPCVQRYQPIRTPEKDSYLSPNWSERYLKDFMRYWMRQFALGGITFEEYRGNKRRQQAVSKDQAVMELA